MHFIPEGLFCVLLPFSVGSSLTLEHLGSVAIEIFTHDVKHVTNVQLQMEITEGGGVFGRFLKAAIYTININYEPPQYKSPVISWCIKTEV